MNNGLVTEGWAQGRQTLRLGFDVFCLFPNLVVPTFLQTAVNEWNLSWQSYIMHLWDAFPVFRT